MSENKRPTKDVTLLGKPYTIACNPGEEASLDRAAQYLDRAMKGVHAHSKTLGSEKVAIMAALNIANELLQQSDQQRIKDADVARLSERLERALETGRNST